MKMNKHRRYGWERLTLTNSIPVAVEEGQTLITTYDKVKQAWMMYRYLHQRKQQPYIDCEFVADIDKQMVFVILKAEGRRSITPRQAARIKKGPTKTYQRKVQPLPLTEYPFNAAG
jgi:hypothetical protein